MDEKAACSPSDPPSHVDEVRPHGDLSILARIRIEKFARSQKYWIPAYLKRTSTLPAAVRTYAPKSLRNSGLSFDEWQRMDVETSTGSVTLELGSKLGEGATGLIYAVHLRSPTTIDIPPWLCFKIAKPPFVRALAREAWFYEQLEKKGLDGVIAPRCFGMFVIHRNVLNSGGTSYFKPWGDMEKCRNHSFELEDDPDVSCAEKYYYDGPGLDSRYESPWMDWEYNSKNPLIAVLLMERMETFYEPLGTFYDPTRCKENENQLNDIRAVVDDLSHAGMEHGDVRFNNFMRPFEEVPGKFCARHNKVHSWRAIDFAQSNQNFSQQDLTIPRRRMEGDQKHRAHRPSKRDKKGKGKEKQSGGFNEKAFAPKSGRNADRQGRRKVELDQTRLHVPLVNRTPDDEPPPVLVAIVGPPGVGKTTLLKSLVRRYAKQTLSDVKGPVTVVSGKKRRLTFVECNNDLGSMIDIGKVADLILLMVDGSFGFEMETFEFLNILQSHGFPKVLGILTHLDLIKKASVLRNTKKTLKKRFWGEIYQGAKLFYLSGVLNGRYPDREILNLSRFISVMKFRPLVFRNTHPYLLADRLEDLTPRELVRTTEGKCDRTVTLYGYLRGTNLRPGQRVHVAGVGDLDVKSVEVLNDPCPLPGKDPEEEKKRKLSEKKKLVIHAPMSDVGGVVYDKDAVWINVKGSFSRGNGEVPQGEGEQMVMDLQDVDATLEDRVAKSQIKLFGSSSKHLTVGGPSGSTSAIPSDDEDEEDGDDSGLGSDLDDEDEDGDDIPSDLEDDEGDLLIDPNETLQNTGRTSRRIPARSLPSSSKSKAQDAVEYAESDSDLDLDDDDDEGGSFKKRRVQFGGEDEDQDVPSDEDEDEEMDEDEDEEVPKWKLNMRNNIASLSSARKKKDWTKLIYSTSLTPEQIVRGEEPSQQPEEEEDIMDDDDDFFTIKKKSDGAGEQEDDKVDKAKDVLDSAALEKKWDDEDLLDSIRGLFITGGDEAGFEGDGAEGSGAEGEEEFGGVDEEDEDEDEGEEQADAPPANPEEARKAALAAKKEALKRKFDQEYDDPDAAKVDFYTEKKEEINRQLELNRAEFAALPEEARLQVEGYRPGLYVRLELTDVPCEMVEHFDPTYPIVVGGLLPTEERFGFVQVRIKRHRWFGRTLKNNDPLIFSLGWRRFQTVPIYSLDDHSIRMRMLKYTPEHMHCYATFYGPMSLPNTGFCAFNSLSSHTPDFRVTATGVVLNIDRSVKIVKKLKLTGVPLKVYKNTAFIREMFSTALEVVKFEGANIKTVSGIRGQIKKALSKPEGAFRATFEDKILMSDIVFLRAWYSVQPRKYYNPVASLLLADKSDWQGMRLTGQVRRDQGFKTPLNVNSTYKPIERPARKFNPLVVPKKLQAALPYASKPKLMQKQKGQTYMQKRAVVMEPEEKKAVALLQQMRALRKDQVQRRREKKEEKKVERRKRLEREEEKRGEKEKEKKKEAMRAQGQRTKREREAEEGGGSRKRRKS